MWLWLACADDRSPTGPSRGAIPDPPAEDSAPVADSDSPADSGGDSGLVDPDRVVRFVALGDGGEGNETQYQVADVLKTVCAAQGCDFALYLGDNIYYDGPDAVDDPQFEDKFELPYAEIDFPFWVVLGNHDYGGGGSGYEFWKANYEIDYTLRSEKWTLPDTFYSFVEGPVSFYGLDTNAMYWGFYEDQLEWLQAELAGREASWNIAFGHHMYLSNGPHGNAGDYDGYDVMPISDGEGVKEFMERGVCGQIDVYLCGHDHSRQWLESVCGTEFIVSGAAAKASHLDGENPVWFESDVPGFMWVEIDGNSFRGQFWNEDGEMDFERVVER